MANSLMNIVSDGNLSVVPLTIKYLEQAHIKVYVNDVQLPAVGYTFVWSAINTITVTPAVAMGATLSIRRNTPMIAPLHEFQAGAVFNELSVDENFQQELFLLQEASEQSLVKDFFTDVNMHGNRITNLGTAELPTDAVNLEQARYLADGGEAITLRAELAADGGVALVNGAATQADLSTLGTRVLSLETTPTKNLIALAVANALRMGTYQKAASYGDSTGYGYKVGGPLPTTQVDVPPTLALSNLMADLQLPLTVVNRCISSTTLDSMLQGTDGSGSTFEAKVSAGGVDHDADLIYCNHAINDCAANVAIEQFRSNLIEFVRLCRINGIVPVLVTPNPNPPIYTVTEDRSRRLALFAATTRSVATEFTVDLVDQYLYFDNSQKVETMASMVPDGIHPSDAMYLRAGQNLAIPIISALIPTLDVSGITGVSYKDNLTGRSIAGYSGRLGLTINAIRGPQPQAIHIPVLLDKAVAGFSLYGTESALMDKVKVAVNRYAVGTFTDSKIYGDLSFINTDYRCMVNWATHAGLQLISLTYDTVAATGTAFAFSGISLSPDAFQQRTTNTAGSASKLLPIGSGYSARTLAKLDASNELVFTDRNASPVVKVKNVANVFTVELVANGAIVNSYTSAGFFTDGSYLVDMAVSDTTLNIAAGATGISIPLTHKLPEVFLYTPALVCDVVS